MGWVNSQSTEKVWEKTFQNYEVPKYFMRRNSYSSQTMCWANSHFPELVWENTDNSQAKPYLTDLELMETHAITNVPECANFHTMEIFCGKPYHSQASWLWENYNLLRNSKNPQSMSQVKYHTMRIPKKKLLYSHIMDFTKNQLS